MMGRTESRLGKLGSALLIALSAGCDGSKLEVGIEPGGAGGEANPQSATGGAAGAGEAEGGTTAVAGPATLDPEQLDPPPGATRTDKIDLLFVVDNSASMQDKQVVLSRTVPTMLRQILNPPCIDEAGNIVAEMETPDLICPEDSVRTHIPVKDMHIGVLSSSLGGHGNPWFCEGRPGDEEGNDRGHLISDATRPSAGLAGFDYSGLGFVAWDDRDADDPEKPSPPGESDLAVVVERVQSFIMAAGEEGCGFEATLESMYRFLIDPAPPQQIVQQGEVTVRQGIDSEILAQREAFLRPDSALVVVVMSDENDCSILDSGYGWLAGENQISLGTSACAVDPNDECCTHCGFPSAPEGCPDISADPACQLPKDNAQNVRCWDQKRRFGIDLLYPTSRYVTGLRDAYVCPDSSFPDADCRCRRAEELGVACDPGEPVPNPLYQDLSGQGPVRDRSLVTLISIVGVPWQDLATDATVGTPDALEYKSGPDIDWDLVVGDPTLGVAPADPLMVERPAPRTDLGPHPITGIAPASPDSGPWANPINGHEWSPQNQEDLQYACVFDLAPVLAAPRDCNVIDRQTCDCFDPSDDLAGVNLRKKPLCHGEDGYGPVQVRAKAYPGLRYLEVVRGLETEGYAASICPKVLDDETSPYYGYSPAVRGLLSKLRHILN